MKTKPKKPKPLTPPPACEHAWRYEHTSQDECGTTITSRCTKCGVQVFTTQTREIEE
jgi:hypothetical protein